MKKEYHKYICGILLSLMAPGFISCDDEKEVEPSYPAVMEIGASSDGMFSGDGGTFQMLVKANVGYDIDVDVDWITPVVSRAGRPENGCVEFRVARYDKAATWEPRVGVITLTADGVEAVKTIVSQKPQDVFRFEITSVSQDKVPAKGATLEIGVDTNVEVTVSSPDWIVEGGSTLGKYVFTVAENTVAESRQGTVRFSTGELGDFKVDIVQEPYVEPGGISTPEQLMQFAAAVNAGEPLEQWTGDNGEIMLRADLDMAGYTWVPIGNVTAATISNTAATLTSAKPFKGVFNGNGHTIRNLAMETDKAQCFGLFGACENAVVRNLNIDATCTLKIDNEALAGGSMYGFVVGLAINSTLEDISVAGHVLPSVIYKVKTNYLNCLAGIAGYVVGSEVRRCVYSGIFDAVRSNVYHASLCSNVSGIVGYALGSKNSLVRIEGCVNSGYVYGRTNRAAGILAGSNGSYVIKDCRNDGVVHSSVAEATGAGWKSGVRVGGILSFALCKAADAATADIIDCVNNGTVLCEGDAASIAGGVLGNPRCHHLVSAFNYGTVIATGGGSVGAITGQYAYGDKPTVESAGCGGRIAYDFTGEKLSVTPVNPVTITADNYFDYAVGIFTGTADGSWTKNKVTFVTR